MSYKSERSFERSMIPHEYIEELTRRTDIVELVGSYVQLKRKGRLYGGLCPFHSEKTPSFYVYPDTQSFYCFGCQAAGDAISFVKKINNISSGEAIKMLASRAGMPEPQEDDKTGRLRSLLADISTITRMDEASQLIRKEPVVLNDLIAETAADMELRPADQRLRVHVDFPRRVEVFGNPSLLASVFRNLADNAAAYSGGRDIFIRLVDDTPEECTILFADNGIGIGEEHLPHIFERFYRIDKGRSRKQGGTGLGLAIVKNAVAIHGGTITARERERGGLGFVFTLKKHS